MSGSRASQGGNGRNVQTVFLLRLRCTRSPEGLAAVFTTIRRAGGDLRLHVIRMDAEGYHVSCVCEHAAEAALALQEQELDAGLETAVWVETEDRPGALGHLVRSVEAAGVRVRASLGASTGQELRAVLQTDDNPRAEDVLRVYLELGT